MSLSSNAIELCGHKVSDRERFVMNNGFKFGDSASSHGPSWNFLSENLQSGLVQYLFSVGINPEIGLCVEYLSWNKE